MTGTVREDPEPGRSSVCVKGLKSNVKIQAETQTFDFPAASPKVDFVLKNQYELEDDGVQSTTAVTIQAPLGNGYRDVVAQEIPEGGSDTISKKTYYYDGDASTLIKTETPTGYITDIRDPINDEDVANKRYVDTHGGGGGLSAGVADEILERAISFSRETRLKLGGDFYYDYIIQTPKQYRVPDSLDRLRDTTPAYIYCTSNLVRVLDIWFKKIAEYPDASDVLTGGYLDRLDVLQNGDLIARASNGEVIVFSDGEWAKDDGGEYAANLNYMKVVSKGGHEATIFGHTNEAYSPVIRFNGGHIEDITDHSGGNTLSILGVESLPSGQYYDFIGLAFVPWDYYLYTWSAEEVSHDVSATTFAQLSDESSHYYADLMLIDDKKLAVFWFDIVYDSASPSQVQAGEIYDLDTKQSTPLYVDVTDFDGTSEDLLFLGACKTYSGRIFVLFKDFFENKPCLTELIDGKLKYLPNAISDEGEVTYDLFEIITASGISDHLAIFCDWMTLRVPTVLPPPADLPAAKTQAKEASENVKSRPTSKGGASLLKQRNAMIERFKKHAEELKMTKVTEDKKDE